LKRERSTYASGSAHGIGHLLVAAQRLDAQSDRLQLRAHLDELLGISTRADQVLRHDLASILRGQMGVAF